VSAVTQTMICACGRPCFWNSTVCRTESANKGAGSCEIFNYGDRRT
jgi:hypothetical protein